MNAKRRRHRRRERARLERRAAERAAAALAPGCSYEDGLRRQQLERRIARKLRRVLGQPYTPNQLDRWVRLVEAQL